MFCLGSGPCHCVSPGKVKARNDPDGVARRRRNKTKLSSFFNKTISWSPKLVTSFPKMSVFHSDTSKVPTWPSHHDWRVFQGSESAVGIVLSSH